MNNFIKCVAVGHKKETTIETRTKLSQAYDLINNFLKDTKFYIGNGTDILGDSIRMEIVGNINEQLDTKALSEIATVTKTVVKKNKKYITVKILKKSLSPKNEKSETKEKSNNGLISGRSPFKYVYDDGHNHQFNKDGYCYLCGVNKKQLQTIKIEIDPSDLIEKNIEKVLKGYGWTDEYLMYQLRALIFEIDKGVQAGFKFFPDETYLNEKIRKVLSRIQDLKHDAQIRIQRESRRTD